MTITSTAKHDTCRVQIDCNTTNAHGRPALVCKDCIVQKGKRAGKPEVIQWISKEDFEILYSMPDVDFSGDPVPFLKKPKSEHKYYSSNISVVHGAKEPDYTEGVSDSIEQHTAWF